jgi:signal transduction histidine kinase
MTSNDHGTEPAWSGDVAPQDPIATRVARTVALSAYLPTLCAILTLTAVIAHLGWLFWAVTPPGRLAPWLGYMAAVLAAMLAAVPLEATVRPRARHAKFWGRYFAVAVLCSNLGVAASAWVLLPTAGPALQLYMVVLYAWYVIVLLHTHRTEGRMVFAGVAVILGSVLVFWLTQEAPLQAPVTAFLVLFGATVLVLHRALQRTMREALASRFEAEDAQARLMDALAEVSAERDAKARFIAAASHDLQQPIQAARLYFDLLARGAGASRKAAATGGRSAFLAVETLLDDMLQHLRLESSAVQAAPARVCLRALLEDLALQFKPAAANAGMSIVIVDTCEMVVTDRDLLRRALGNLIDNAIKHSGGRSIELCAWEADHDAVVVSVRDDGRGMTPENVARLLDADTSFRRVAGASAPGFGLGAPSARQIAHLLGGALRLTSNPGQGCAFELEVRQGPALAA